MICLMALEYFNATQFLNAINTHRKYNCVTYTKKKKKLILSLDFYLTI